MNVKVFGALVVLVGCIGCSTAVKDTEAYKARPAEEIYTLGKTYTQEGRYEAAVKAFEALEAYYPYGQQAEKSQLALMYIHYKKGDIADTLAAAERFISMHPYHTNIDYAYYLKGLAHYADYETMVYRFLPLASELRDPTEARFAFDAFKLLLERFPKSPYCQDARMRMIYLRNKLAAHEVAVGEYYLRRGNYLAAVNRGLYVLQNYDRTTSLPQALKVIHTGYVALPAPELAAHSQRVLELNYPE